MPTSHPKLPGTPSRRRPVVVADDRVGIHIDHQQLERDLLAALADGPLMKWELRERLHVDEQIIFRQLQRLKTAGQVKVTGQVLDKRAWALQSWQPPAAAPPISDRERAARLRSATKGKAPADSWWARPQMTREQFNDARETRDRELGRTGTGQVIR